MKEIVDDLKTEIANNRLKLPTQPEIAVKIREIENDPKLEAEKIASVINKDPGLTARIIKIANSPLMRGRVQINSLPLAINRLGFKFVCNTTTGLAMEQIFQATHEVIDKWMYKIWSDSSAVAAIAYVIAKHFTQVAPDVACLAGLMHKVGVLPILAYAQEKDVLLENEPMLNEIIQNFQAKLGEAILFTWEFPKEIINIPRGVADPKRIKDQADVLTNIILISLDVHHQNQGETIDPQAHLFAYKQLGLDPELNFMSSPSIQEDLQCAMSIYNNTH